MASFSPPQDPSPPTHPSGVVVEIVGTERGDQGRSCEEHHINCGEVLAEEVVLENVLQPRCPPNLSLLRYTHKPNVGLHWRVDTTGLQRAD